MAAAGTLPFPVVAADASITRRMFDNGHGTGQSVIDGLLRATNMLLAGKTVVVAGFGPCGAGSRAGRPDSAPGDRHRGRSGPRARCADVRFRVLPMARPL